MKNIFVIIIFVSICSLTNAQWTIQYHNGSGQEQFNSICMADENIGFAVGPKIYATTNEGVDWINVPESFQELYSVFSPTSNIGVAVGKNGTIVKTTDGGSTWSSRSSGSSKYLWSVFFSSQNVGWVAGGNYVSGAVILKTTDQGETWQEKYSTGSGLFREIHFVSNEIGWAVGYNSDGPIIVKTTDGGGSWQTLDCGIDDCWFYAVYFLNENIGWIAGESNPQQTSKVLLLQTTDGGTNWNSKINNKFGDIQSLKMRDANNGWAVGLASDLQSGLHFETTDGGNNWIHRTQHSIFFNNIFFLNASNGWAVTSVSIYKYDNPSSVVENSHFPEYFTLHQNYTNPFNPSTTISYSIPKLSFVKLVVYDLLGKEITTLVNEEKPKGIYEVELNAKDLSSGIYFYRIQAGKFTNTKKFILLK